MGPCQEIFGGVYNSIDVFYKMAECLGLSRSQNTTKEYGPPPSNWGKPYGPQFGYEQRGPQSPAYGGGKPNSGW